MTALGRLLVLVVCASFAAGPAASRPNGARSKRRRVDIVPGKSIGVLHLGQRRRDLPDPRAVDDGFGELGGIHFLLDADIVAELWIDDIRSFPGDLRAGGRPLPATSTIDEVKKRFGPCLEAPPRLGGTEYLCKSGVRVGHTLYGAEEYIQIRVKRP
jgi:hypothetical protein